MLGISVNDLLIYIQMNTTQCPPNGLGTREKDIVLPSPPPPPKMVQGTGAKDILFYFRDQVNNILGIPCESLFADLSKGI